MLPRRDALQKKKVQRLKVKGWKKYSKQMDMEKKPGQQFSYQIKYTSKQKFGSNTIIVGDFNIPLSKIDRY